jgi:hypothetical protein
MEIKWKDGTTTKEVDGKIVTVNKKTEKMELEVQTEEQYWNNLSAHYERLNNYYEDKD